MGSLNVGGHKIPYALLGLGIGAAGLLLVLRARQGGGSVAALGATPTAADTSVGTLGQGQEAQLANLAQQLAGIQQSLNPPGPPPPVATPPVTVPIASAPVPISVKFGDQLHNVFVNASGQLEQQFYDPRSGGKWYDEIIGGGPGYRGGSTPNVTVYKGQFQVMTPLTSGAIAHDWYDPASGWHHTLLSPGLPGETPR